MNRNRSIFCADDLLVLHSLLVIELVPHASQFRVLFHFVPNNVFQITRFLHGIATVRYTMLKRTFVSIYNFLFVIIFSDLLILDETHWYANFRHTLQLAIAKTWYMWWVSFSLVLGISKMTWQVYVIRLLYISAFGFFLSKMQYLHLLKHCLA